MRPTSTFDFVYKQEQTYVNVLIDVCFSFFFCPFFPFVMNLCFDFKHLMYSYPCNDSNLNYLIHNIINELAYTYKNANINNDYTLHLIIKCLSHCNYKTYYDNIR